MTIGTTLIAISGALGQYSEPCIGEFFHIGSGHARPPVDHN